MPQGWRGLQGRAERAGLPGVAPPMGGMGALSLLGCEGEWGRPGWTVSGTGQGAGGVVRELPFAGRRGERVLGVPGGREH